MLLHPEGTPSWHGDAVGPLVPGIVEMAREAARTLPSFLVPLVWKLRFTRDVSRELGGEMARLEQGLGLPDGRALDVAGRFAQLERAILARSVEHFAGSAPGGDFFEAQEAHAQALLSRLEANHGVTQGVMPRRLHALRRAILARAAAIPERAPRRPAGRGGGARRAHPRARADRRDRRRRPARGAARAA